MVGIVHGRAVHDLRAVANRQIVRYRDGLAMSDAEAVKVASPRRPCAYAGAGARLHEVDGRHATEVVPLAVAGEIPLVSAPAHLARLRPLAHEAVDRPGVDEFAGL